MHPHNQQLRRRLNLARCQLLLPATFPTSRSCCCKPCICPFTDQILFKLGKSPENLQDELPPLVVVSNPSCRLIKPTTRPSRSSTTSSRCLSDRLRRSNRRTTRLSPVRTYARASARPGRSAVDPLILSWKIFSQPAFF